MGKSFTLICSYSELLIFHYFLQLFLLLSNNYLYFCELNNNNKIHHEYFTY